MVVGVVRDVVRRAHTGDAAALVSCRAACWREAYIGSISASVIEKRHGDMSLRVQRWRRILAGPARTWVAVDGGDVVGFSSTGPPRDEQKRHLVELYALYARASRYGTGLADRLLEPALGDAPAFLWVLECNPRAQAYYAKAGFRADGTVRIDDELGGVRQVRLVR